MKNIGIIAEFNPFHNGHKHLIGTVKKPDNRVICVMSGNFVQRGETAIFPKAERARAALSCGVDLVIELPTPWAMSTAQNFAFGAVSILKNTGIIDKIAFGSESADINALTNLASLLYSEEFNNRLREKLSDSQTYAKIRSSLAAEYSPVYNEILSNPNDTLATEYISAANRLGFGCEFSPIKRIGAAHDSSEIDLQSVSASLIREHIKNYDFSFAKLNMPKSAYDIIKQAPISDIKRLENAILVDLRKKLSDTALEKLSDLSEGLENRLLKAIHTSTSLDELYEQLKTKRYTLARIRRIILSAFLDIDNSYFQKSPPYIRVLGFNEDSVDLLKDLISKSSIPVIVNISDIDKLDEFGLKVWETENTATNIFALSLNNPQKCGNEYYHKIIKGDF